ncbi:MAG: MATE family efflux transporter [Pseudomonadales bacterium]
MSAAANARPESTNSGELRQLLRLAAPIILAQLSQMGLGVADTIMAGRVSATDLAGVALGGNLYFPLFMLVSGVVMSINPTVSQLSGAGRVSETGEVARQALWIALFGGILVIACLQNAAPVYTALDVDPLAIPIAAEYLNAVSFGVLPVLGYFAMRYLCEGLSWTKPAMFIAFGALLLKVPLNYWFIYGGFGVPAMGGVGCGWATALVCVYQCCAMALVVSLQRMRIAGFYEKFSLPNWQTIRKLVLLGVPIGAIAFMEIALFSGTTLMIGRLGVATVAAHQIAMNVAGLAFMVPLALGIAASIRVGTHTGAGDIPAARRAGGIAILSSLVFAAIMALSLYWGRHWMTALYTTDDSVMALAAQLMLWAAAFQLVDASQSTAIGALRGYKDTRTPMILALIAYWLIGFPVAVIFGLGLFGAPTMGVHGFWMGLSLGLTVACVALIRRFSWLSQRQSAIERLSQS